MRTLLNALVDTQMCDSCVTLFICPVFISFSAQMLFDVYTFVLILTGSEAILRSFKQLLQLLFYILIVNMNGDSSNEK